MLKSLLGFLYYRCYYPIRIRRLRKQPVISVVFKIENLGAWKTEELYKLMLEHPRFAPKLFITNNAWENDLVNLRAYCERKGYKYLEIDGDKTVWDYCYPDMVFFQKPYRDTFDGLKRLITNHKTLFCYVQYSFHSSIEPWSYDWPYLKKCWQVYYENKPLARQYASLLQSKIPNSYASGLPMMDELISSPSQVTDQWKTHPRGKKRIIFAPHWSIIPDAKFNSSTFLETGEAILKLAEKYSDRVQWAFKPHPLLYANLVKIWGQKRTDDYYNRWTTAEWSQYENGKYLGLFKHSDAMIHDCGSFLMEYLYENKPCMYLIKNERLAETWNDGYKSALRLYYHARSEADIEAFIRDVINGVDSKKPEREKFIDENLTPPNGVTAAQNIIDSILDKNKAKKMLVK